MSYSTTVFGTVPENYYTKKNIDFIINEVSKILSKEFKQKIVYDSDSVKRILQRVFEEKLEEVPRMNDRAIMYLCANARSNIAQRDVRFSQEKNFENAMSLYDASAQRGVDLHGIRLKHHLGKPKVGGTMGFYFT
jgi:hypothetical protein